MVNNEPDKAKRKTASETLTAGQQRRQASILLLRLQWLLILLLIIALVWLYVSQQRFENQVNERLQSNEQMVTRLNEMDDRLFAISQQTLPAPNVAVGSQAQNQLSLLRIQMQAADRLLTDSNDSAAIDLLRGLHWQLSQDSNEIAPALSIVIKQSLSEDIERLQAQRKQPSPWQLRSLAIQNIQEFLHSYEPVASAKSNSAAKSPTAAVTQSSLSTHELIIHEVIMTLNLAIQASNMHEQDQLNSYLRQARRQLQSITPAKSSTTKNSTTKSSSTKNNAAKNSEPQRPTVETTEPSEYNLDTIGSPSTIAEVIVWLDKLIANEPTSTPLLTTQVLEQPKS